MKKQEIINYIKKDNNEIVNFVKEIEIKDNNEANKLKNILIEFKEIEREYLIPIITSKKEKYWEYKEVALKEKDIKDKADFIKNIISNKLTEWNKSKLLINKKGEVVETKIITNSVVKKYKQIEIEILDINEVPDEFIIKYLSFNEVKKRYQEDKQQIKGLKITEREVIK